MLRSATILLFLTCPASLLAQDLTAHGNFRHLMHMGEAAGTVAIDTLEVPQGWGVGALAGLKGEVVIPDGQVLVSRGDDPQARLTPPQAGEEAAILAYGQVGGWQSVTLPHEMTAGQLAMFIGHQGAGLGLNLEAGFPLRLQGSFTTQVWHVVTGEAPAQGHGGGHRHWAMPGGGHANTQSGMNVFEEPGIAGAIVGIYTGAALEGIASHPGERLHLHFVDSERTRSGHIDEVAFAAGTSLLLPVVASDAMDHAGHGAALADSVVAVTEGGQSAFAAIQEIVALLIADPATDWERVDVEALRQHLIDMDNVTLRARVTNAEVDGGARFIVTADDPAVITSIRAMVPAHAATMESVDDWTMRAKEIPGGSELTVTGADPVRIRALGFIGFQTVGMHHQTHHLALASGQEPHLE